MANKDNQSKQHRIYVKESKSWVDVNKEFYTNYYRDINAYRKRQQEHGRCVCPASKRSAAVLSSCIFTMKLSSKRIPVCHWMQFVSKWAAHHLGPRDCF